METVLPDDPKLPGLAAIRTVRFAAAFPELEFDHGSAQLRLCGYTRGDRATIEARAGDRHFAIKAYAKDPFAEVLLYRALADAGLASGSGVQVPRLLGWNRDLRLIVISWLAGRPVNELIRRGEGRRAGMLAAAFLRRVTSVRLKIGPTFDPGELMLDVGRWVARLGDSDPPLGYAADKVVNLLLHAMPNDRHPRLIHGTFYERHILDLGDGPGVIDWQRFGQGPLELDAGTFLATISRIALRDRRLTDQVERVEEAFRDGTRRLLDERSLSWFEATTVLRHAAKPFHKCREKSLMTPDQRAVALAEAEGLVEEAGHLAEAIA